MEGTTEEDCRLKGAIMHDQTLTASFAARNVVHPQICQLPKVGSSAHADVSLQCALPFGVCNAAAAADAGLCIRC